MNDGKRRTSTQYKNQYNSINYDSLRIVVPKGRKSIVEGLAKSKGESVNGFVNELLRGAAGLSADEWKNG